MTDETYYARNKEKVTLYLREYYRKNKKILAQKQREKRASMTAEERAEENAYRRIYYAANAEKLREQNRTGRARRKALARKKSTTTKKGVSP